MDPVFLDSITDAVPSDQGKVGISGSHGGVYAAAVASYKGLRAVVLNDAGFGMDDAGVAGLRKLNDTGMAGVAVSCQSAEIGSAKDTLENGIISFVNDTAKSLGLELGQKISVEIAKLNCAPTPAQRLEPAKETRKKKQIEGVPVLCVDSAALITPQDAGRIIVTGSHGGLIGANANRACKAQAKLVAFNDAGGGKNGIGFSRLPALQNRKIAAITLDCMTCRIGDAASAISSGVVSAVNLQAQMMGIKLGQKMSDAIVCCGV